MTTKECRRYGKHIVGSCYIWNDDEVIRMRQCASEEQGWEGFGVDIRCGRVQAGSLAWRGRKSKWLHHRQGLMLVCVFVAICCVKSDGGSHLRPRGSHVTLPMQMRSSCGLLKGNLAHEKRVDSLISTGRATDRHLSLRGGGDVEMDQDAEARIEKEKKQQREKRAEKKKWKKHAEKKKLMEDAEKSQPQIVHGPDGVIYALDPDFPQDVNFVPKPIPDMDEEALDLRVANSTEHFARENKEGAETVNPFAYITCKPLADGNLEKRVLDLITECDKAKQTKKGANEVTKAINRNMAEFIVIACDTKPIEIVLHLPLLCEDKGVPFVWVSTRQRLGEACGVPRPVTAIAILSNEQSHLTGNIRKLRVEIDNLPYGY